MRHDTIIPSDTVVQAHVLPPAAGLHRFLVLLARPPAEPTPEALAAMITEPGAVCACMTHDPGWSWPDATGAAIVEDVLERGGVVRLGFARLSDARACERRVRRAAR